MKRFLLTALISLNVFVSFAQIVGDDFYRIQNKGSQRYLYVKDNKGSVSVQATSADLGAIELWKNFDRAVSDPSSVIYIKHVSGVEYRFHSQGTDSHEIVGYDLRLNQSKKVDSLYTAYQAKGGMSGYLCDGERKDKFEKGVMSTQSSPEIYKVWIITPVRANSHQYFGITPDFETSGEKISSFYAEFPFSFASQGMRAYYVKRIERGMAIIEEVKEKILPGGMPMLIKCSSENPSNNRLELGKNSAKLPTGNLLAGNYFHNTHKGNHRNLTPYDPETMRMLSVSSDGKLVFIKSDIDYLPANKAYLKVPVGTDDQLLVVTQKEFDDIIASGVEEVITAVEDQKVYTVSGTMVGQGKEVLTHLPAGIYIMGGKKYIIK